MNESQFFFHFELPIFTVHFSMFSTSCSKSESRNLLRASALKQRSSSITNKSFRLSGITHLMTHCFKSHHVFRYKNKSNLPWVYVALRLLCSSIQSVASHRKRLFSCSYDVSSFTTHTHTTHSFSQWSHRMTCKWPKGMKRHMHVCVPFYQLISMHVKKPVQHCKFHLHNSLQAPNHG